MVLACLTDNMLPASGESPCMSSLLSFHTSLHSYQKLKGKGKEVEDSKCAGPACRLELQWDKARLFDQEVAQLYQHLVAQAGQLRVASVAESDSRKHRPHGKVLILYLSLSREKLACACVLVHSV